VSKQDGAVGRREIRVLIVDDHEVVAASLRGVLDAEPDLSTVGTAATLEEARRQVAACARSTLPPRWWC